MSEDDESLEFSSLSGPFTENGTTVRVMIYKPKDQPQGWTLEVAIDGDNSVIFDDLFDTDAEAQSEFEAIIAENGLADLLDAPDQKPARNS